MVLTAYVVLLCPQNLPECANGRFSPTARRANHLSRSCCQRCLFVSVVCFPSCPGRGAAFFTLLRRAGTYIDIASGPRISSAPRRKIGVGKASSLPSLRTVRAVLPHTALQSPVSSSGVS